MALNNQNQNQGMKKMVGNPENGAASNNTYVNSLQNRDSAIYEEYEDIDKAVPNQQNSNFRHFPHQIPINGNKNSLNLFL